jgi:hypothetical protein
MQKIDTENPQKEMPWRLCDTFETVSNNGCFVDGFVEGWKLIAGNRASVPAIPAATITPTSKNLYEAGLLHGMEAARKRKGIC